MADGFGGVDGPSIMRSPTAQEVRDYMAKTPGLSRYVAYRILAQAQLLESVSKIENLEHARQVLSRAISLISSTGDEKHDDPAPDEEPGPPSNTYWCGIRLCALRHQELLQAYDEAEVGGHRAAFMSELIRRAQLAYNAGMAGR